MEGGKSLCRPCIKDQKWLKKIVINKEIYQFHFRTKQCTAVPYRLQNRWEEIFDVPIPWHMVYELVRNKEILDSTEFFDLNYIKFLSSTERYIYGAYNNLSSVDFAAKRQNQ